MTKQIPKGWEVCGIRRGDMTLSISPEGLWFPHYTGWHWRTWPRGLEAGPLADVDWVAAAANMEACIRPPDPPLSLGTAERVACCSALDALMNREPPGDVAEKLVAIPWNANPGQAWWGKMWTFLREIQAEHWRPADYPETRQLQSLLQHWANVWLSEGAP